MSIFGKFNMDNYVPPVPLTEKEETPEKKYENTGELMAYYSEQANKVFEKYKKGKEDLVDNDCKINPRYFNTKNGGAYSVEEVEADEELKEDLYNKWAAKEYNLTEDTDVDYIIEKVAEYKRSRETSLGEQSEKLLLLNLNKILSPTYFAIHSSDYDDLSNGVDYVVVEAETGVIACGLDVFYDNQEGSEDMETLLSDTENFKEDLSDKEQLGRSYQQKLVKLKKISERYGAKIKYGFSIKDGEMTSGYMSNMPAFALRLSGSEFNKLRKDMNFVVEGDNSRPSSTELSIFDGLISSLEGQSKYIAANPKVNSDVSRNLEIFNKALERMKEIRRKI